MSSQIYAIGICRVSSDEQLKNNSLRRQRAAIEKEAKRLGATIPDEYWFSGSVSSKRGTNLKRKDLEAIKKLCKKDKRIKFIIVDEPDRFMRSIEEAAYFEVTFSSIGVRVWYASDPELNKGDLSSKLLKFTKYLAAEGSNEERQRKSINGQTKALEEGRYPFHPKPGYRRGYIKGIPEIDQRRGPALKLVLESMAAGLLTPTQALKQLNNGDFVKGRTPYKMDKFRNIATDPFYAGIVEVNKQVKVRNVNGVHTPLISLATHTKLLTIFNSKTKNQSGPLKDGNPKYPCNNIVFCDYCKERSNGRVVGFDLTNGKPNSKIYEKYRCRGCKRSLSRHDLHDMVGQQFRVNSITAEGRKTLLKALKTVWKQKEGDLQTEKMRMEHKLTALKLAIGQQVEAAIDPANMSIKDNILESIAKKKEEAGELEYKISTIQASAAADEERFLQFALAWVDKMGDNFLAPELFKENRLRCKQIVFPAGFRLDKNGKVYTPEISPLITLQATKKDAEASSMVNLVRVRGL